MAISAVMFFQSTGDVRIIYDSVLDEMGTRDNPAPGQIYHWCAPVRAGMHVCDMWETREQFERFAKDKIGPLSAKHGLGPPSLVIAQVHEFIAGRATSHKGAGVLIDFDGETERLLRQIDRMNQQMDVVAEPPQGLAIHWTMPSVQGIRVVDHWQSHEDFAQFVRERLEPAIESAGLPEPRVTEFNVYNCIDRRVLARV